MSSNWTPDQKLLNELYDVIASSSQGTTGERQRSNTEKLEKWRVQIPHIHLYFAYILATPTASDPSIAKNPSEVMALRAMAGLLLKNHIYRARPSSQGTPQQSPLYSQLPIIQSVALKGLEEDAHLIASTCGSLISAIISKFGFECWPNLFNTLVDLINAAASRNVIESALSTLSKISEDCSFQLVNDYPQIVDHLILQLLEWSEKLPGDFNYFVILSLNQFISLRPNALTQSLERFVSALSSTSATNLKLQKLTCKSLVLLFDSYLEQMLPIIPTLMEYMLNLLNNDSDHELALEACEFWLSLSHQIHAIHEGVIDSILPRLVPTLLKNMRYEDTDPIYLENCKEDDPTKPQVVKLKDSEASFPKHHKVKTSIETSSHTKSKKSHVPTILEEGEMTEPEERDSDDHRDGDDDYSVDDDDDDDDFENEDATDWNLRKCSAATLDTFSLSFSSKQANEILLPNIFKLIGMQEKKDWLWKEVGILSLGAIQSGSEEYIKPHQSQLVPFLISQLADKKPLIRSITLWTLSRYSDWIVDQYQASNKALYENTLQGILSLLVDRNRRVQGNALTTLEKLLETTPATVLFQYASPILQALINLFNVVQKRNLFLVYDNISLIGSNLSGKLKDRPDIFQMVFPVIASNLQLMTDNDYAGIFPILEALSSLCTAFGPLVESYAALMYGYCMHFLHYSLMDTSDEAYDDEDDDICVSSLELLSSLCSSVPKVRFIQLVSEHSIAFMPIFYRCLSNMSYSIKQSAFALYGDLCRNTPEIIKGQFELLWPMFENNLVPVKDVEASYSVMNNAIWTIGEISLLTASSRQELDSHLESIFKRLCDLMVSQASGVKGSGLPTVLVGNIAVTLGRLASYQPIAATPFLIACFKPWIAAMANIYDKFEKDTSFYGPCHILLNNVQHFSRDGLEEFVAVFKDAISQSPEISSIFSTLK